MLPISWLILGALLAAVLAGGGGFWYGVGVGHDQAEAQGSREERLVAKAADAAASSAAAAIAKIRVRNTTIQQEVQREIQTRVEYRECRHSPDQRLRIDSALAGGDGPEPAGGGELPAADAAR